MPSIEPAPEIWFLSYDEIKQLPRAALSGWRVMVTPAIVAMIDASLDVDEPHNRIAADVGVSVDLVDLLAVVRRQWDGRQNLSGDRQRKAYGGRPTKPIVPIWAKVVPPYQCRETDPPHTTICTPCLICRARRVWAYHHAKGKLG